MELHQQHLCALVTALFLAAIGSSSAQAVIPVQEFKEGLDNGAYDLVLDVRTQQEWDRDGHIPGAIHVSIDNFEQNPFWNTMGAMSSCWKDCATIVTHCQRGGRAGTAIEKLRSMGFEGTLLNAQGTQNWVRAGYALTKADTFVEPRCSHHDICVPATDPPEPPEPPEPAAVETPADPAEDPAPDPVDEEPGAPVIRTKDPTEAPAEVDAEDTPMTANEGNALLESSSSSFKVGAVALAISSLLAVLL